MAVEVLKSDAKDSTAYFAFEPTRDPEDGMSPISRWLSYAYAYTDATLSVISVHVPPGSMVLRVAHRADTAFTGVTAITIGDGAAADGWMATGVATVATAGNFVVDYDSTFTATGKYYADGDTIDITQTGIATAGTGKIFIEVISYAEALAAE